MSGADSSTVSKLSTVSKVRQFVVQRWPVLAGVALLVLIALAIALVRDKFQKPGQPKKQVQQITMLAPPPPPPPPPELPPPPPEEPEQQIEEPAPELEPAAEVEPAPGPPGPPGPSGPAGPGDGPSGPRSRSGNAIIWYGQKVSSAVGDAVRDALVDTAKDKKFKALLNVWLDASGAVQRIELAAPTGNREVDAALTKTLAGVRAQLDVLPPADMPQPVKIRIDNR